MDEVKIKVVCAKLRERFINSTLDVFWGMVVVPELGGDPNVLAGHSAGFDDFSNLGFILFLK